MRMVQIRNVPDELHRKIKARAALAGMSLSDYLLLELRKTLDRPTRQELRECLSKLPQELSHGKKEGKATTGSSR